MIFVFVNSKQTSNRFVLQQRGKYLLAEIPKPPLSSLSVLGKNVPKWKLLYHQNDQQQPTTHVYFYKNKKKTGQHTKTRLVSSTLVSSQMFYALIFFRSRSLVVKFNIDDVVVVDKQGGEPIFVV